MQTVVHSTPTQHTRHITPRCNVQPAEHGIPPPPPPPPATYPGIIFLNRHISSWPAGVLYPSSDACTHAAAGKDVLVLPHYGASVATPGTVRGKRGDTRHCSTVCIQSVCRTTRVPCNAPLRQTSMYLGERYGVELEVAGARTLPHMDVTQTPKSALLEPVRPLHLVPPHEERYGAVRRTSDGDGAVLVPVARRHRMYCTGLHC